MMTFTLAPDLEAIVRPGVLWLEGASVVEGDPRLDGPLAQAEALVRASASDLNQSDLQVTVNPLAGWSQGSDVSVSASYPYQVSLLGIVVSSGNLTATTQERVE